MSDYSENVRARLNRIADFKSEFNNAFAGYIQNELPKDETYIRLMKEDEDKRQILLAKK
jgi:hypothetical protein